MIPLRPELFSFADPQSVCRLSCTCKTLRSDVRDAKPWGLLARAQLQPPKPRDEADALARVRSHVRRRLLAKALPTTLRALEGLTLQQAIARETPAPVAFTPDAFSDFTFFLRLDETDPIQLWGDNAGRLIWEGDLGDLNLHSDNLGLSLHLSLRHANLKWPWAQANSDYLERVRISLVAIRDEDQAMVSLGRFNCFGEGAHNGGRRYDFLPNYDLDFVSSSRSHLELGPILWVSQDGYVNGLYLLLDHNIHNPYHGPTTLEQEFEAYRRERCDESRYRLVLSYLAGVHHPAARASALATIESWFVEAERGAGWPIQE